MPTSYVLNFGTSLGKKRRYTVRDGKTDLTSSQAQAAAEKIRSANVFDPARGGLVTLDKLQRVDVTQTEFNVQ